MAIDWVGQFNQDLLAQALSQSMTKESKSNSVAAQDNPDMIEMMQKARELGDVYDRALRARSDREAAESQAVTSGKNELFSPSSIPLALAALAAGLGGRPDVAAGIGIGAMEGSNVQAARKNEARRQEVDAARGEERAALNQVEGFHNRVNNQLITNWQALVNDAGQQMVSREAAGFLATGAFGMPMDYGLKAKQMQLNADPGKRDRVNFLFQAGKLADSLEDAEAFAVEIYNEMGRRDVSQEDVARLGRSLFQEAQQESLRTGRPAGEGMLEKLVTWMVKEADIETVLPALVRMANVEDPLADMGWAAELTFNGAIAANSEGIQTRTLNQAIDVFSAWVTDPANRTTIEGINQTHGEGSPEALRNMAINAYRGQEHLQIEFDKWAKLNIDMGLSHSDLMEYAIEYQSMLPMMEMLLATAMQGQSVTRMDQIGGEEAFLEMFKTSQNLAARIAGETAPLVITADIAQRFRFAAEALSQVGFEPPEGTSVRAWVSNLWSQASRKYPEDLEAAKAYFDNIVKTNVRNSSRGTNDGN